MIFEEYPFFMGGDVEGFDYQNGIDQFLNWQENALSATAATQIDFRPQSFGLRSEINGFSHGLKKCPPDTFLPSLREGRPFESTIPVKTKKTIQG